MTYRRILGLVVGGALAAAAFVPQGLAADDAAKAAITATLEQWTSDFNTGRADKVCDLFAKDLVADFRGQPERGYDELCALLHRSLSDQARDYKYALEIKEVLAAGDFAVVRLVWTLQITPLNVTSVEPGMDIFRKQADGSWRIVRYIAYEAP